MFTGDGALIGYPGLHAGGAHVDMVTMQQGSFVGNHGVVPCGINLPTGSLVGVQSIAPRLPPGEKIPSHTVWMGNPPIGVPNAHSPKFGWPTWPVHLWKWVSDTAMLGTIVLVFSFMVMGQLAVFQWVWLVAMDEETAADIPLAQDFGRRSTSVIAVVLPCALPVATMLALMAFTTLVLACYYPMQCACCPFRGEEKIDPYWSGHVIRWEFCTCVRKVCRANDPAFCVFLDSLGSERDK
eukprot:SAG31_NODE_557_length_14160_cov_18.420880_2_plen_239_part_00